MNPPAWRCQSAEDFPRLPELTETETFTVDRDALLETIGRVARAASRDESRPVLTGILVGCGERAAGHGGTVLGHSADRRTAVGGPRDGRVLRLPVVRIPRGTAGRRARARRGRGLPATRHA